MNCQISCRAFTTEVRKCLKGPESPAGTRLGTLRVTCLSTLGHIQFGFVTYAQNDFWRKGFSGEQFSLKQLLQYLCDHLKIDCFGI